MIKYFAKRVSSEWQADEWQADQILTEEWFGLSQVLIQL